MNILAWVATAIIILTYFYGSEEEFDFANMALWPFIAIPAFLNHVYTSMVISITFGIIATYKICRGKYGA